MTMKSFLQSLEALKSDNACSCIEQLREIKYAVIGSNLNKVHAVDAGIVTRLLQIMNKDSDIEEMVEAVTILGSLLRGPACVVSTLMRGETIKVLFKGVWHSSLRYVDRCLACLRTIACTTILSLGLIYEQPGLIGRLVSLTAKGWPIAECVLSILARSCSTAAHQHALLNERVVDAVRRLLTDPAFDATTDQSHSSLQLQYPTLLAAACDLLAAITYRNALIAQQVANIVLRLPSNTGSTPDSPVSTTETQWASCSTRVLPPFVAALCDAVGRERNATARIAACRLLAFLALTLSTSDENDNDFLRDQPMPPIGSVRRYVVRRCVPLLARNCKPRDYAARERYDAMLTLAALVECDTFAQHFATINEQLLVNLTHTVRQAELPSRAAPAAPSTLSPAPCDPAGIGNGSTSPASTRKRCYDAIMCQSQSHASSTATGCNTIGWPWLVGFAASLRLSHNSENIGSTAALSASRNTRSTRSDAGCNPTTVSETNLHEACRFGTSSNFSCECALEQALELRYAAFQLLAVLASGDEDVRRRIVELESSLIVSKVVETLEFAARYASSSGSAKCQSNAKCNGRNGSPPGGCVDDHERERVAIAAQLAQVASLRLLQALTRSIHLVRTQLREARIDRPVIDILRCTDATETVRVAACSVVANLLLEFSPFRDSLIRDDGVLDLLVTLCKTESSVALQQNGLHALMNVTFASDSRVKQQVVDKLTLERLLFQLVPHDCADVKLIALGLLRNLLTGRSQIDQLVASASCNANVPLPGSEGSFSQSTGVSTNTQVNLSSRSGGVDASEPQVSSASLSSGGSSTTRCNVSTTNSILQSLVLTFESDANLAVKEQALCVLVNVADGGSSTKALLLANIDLLDKLNSYAMHPSTAIQLSAVTCVQNLLEVSDAGDDAHALAAERRARLNERGLLKTIQSLFRACSNVALLEKLSQILAIDIESS